MPDTFHPNYPGQRRATDPDAALFARDTEEAVFDALILAAKSAMAAPVIDSRALFDVLAEFTLEHSHEELASRGIELDTHAICEEAWDRAEHENKIGRAA